jgi:hypothetical protein
MKIAIGVLRRLVLTALVEGPRTKQKIDSVEAAACDEFVSMLSPAYDIVQSRRWRASKQAAVEVVASRDNLRKVLGAKNDVVQNMKIVFNDIDSMLVDELGYTKKARTGWFRSGVKVTIEWPLGGGQGGNLRFIVRFEVR